MEIIKREEGLPNLFASTHLDWEATRVQKIDKIFGPDFFNGKTLLELGCGYGDMGKYFHEKRGATVTFTEGNKENLEWIKKNNPDCEVLFLDQEFNWDLKRKFDVVLHTGVLYHLHNWQQDLACACKHTDLLILESEVVDSLDPTFEIKHEEEINWAHSMHGLATWMSPPYVERELNKNGFNFVRYDDADLNSFYHIYNWVPRDSGVVIGQRRFWVARRV
jgi:SAM-dependent methyltransferase